MNFENHGGRLGGPESHEISRNQRRGIVLQVQRLKLLTLYCYSIQLFYLFRDEDSFTLLHDKEYQTSKDELRLYGTSNFSGNLSILLWSLSVKPDDVPLKTTPVMMFICSL